MASNNLPKEFEEAFIKVSFQDERVLASSEHDPTYGPWVKNASSQRVDTGVWATDTLRKLYPGHSVIAANPYSTNILGFPKAAVQPINPDEMVLTTFFYPLARRSSVPGILSNSVRFGSFRIAWENYDFILYVTEIYTPIYPETVHFIVHDGPEEASRQLLMAVGLWTHELHDEILVFDQGHWSKSYALWEEIQKADWKDVILEKERKDNIHKDIYGFFKSEHVYRELAIPWKRGIIMYGPPGNGKTISIKAIMKECHDKGFSPLYVKSFQSWQGEEASMKMVFGKARDMAPCVLILEDLDALINDRNRSYFLNQLDGFEGNDGIIVIGTTNHFERLDPAISTRPSRFDRKYLFDDPTEDERILYAQYWQKKLSHNNSIDFPNSLVKDVAHKTVNFSFAYLKEAFVSTLFLLATNDDNKEKSFRDVLMSTIHKLAEDLKKTPHDEHLRVPTYESGVASSTGPAVQHYLPRMPELSEASRARQETSRPGAEGPLGPDGLPQQINGRDIRSLAQAAAKLGRNYIF